MVRGPLGCGGGLPDSSRTPRSYMSDGFPKVPGVCKDSRFLCILPRKFASLFLSISFSPSYFTYRLCHSYHPALPEHNQKVIQTDLGAHASLKPPGAPRQAFKVLRYLALPVRKPQPPSPHTIPSRLGLYCLSEFMKMALFPLAMVYVTAWPGP